MARSFTTADQPDRDAAPGLRRRLAPGALEPGRGARPGQRVPLVGNVAMDAVMADVTDVPGPPVGVDDEFVLIGRRATSDHRAELARPAPRTPGRCNGMARDCPGCTMPRPVPVAVRTLAGGGKVARIQLWNGDICELEVDAIVNPANPSLWMATGVGEAIKRAGGDEIEFAAVRQAPLGWARPW